MQKSVEVKTVISRTEDRKANLSNTLIWLSVVSCLLSMQYGYNIWVSYSPTVLLHDFYNITSFDDMADPDAQLFLMAVTIALFPFGGIFGAVLAACLMDNIGRKNTLLFANVLSLASAFLMSLSNVVYAYEFTMFARMFTGICTGIVSSAVPVYLGEISPRNLRGSIVMMPHFFLTLGVLLAQIFALQEVLGTPKGWPVLMGLSGIMPLSQSVMLPFFPESPRYLMIQKRNEGKAKKVLKMLRERDNVNDEIEELREEDIAEKAEKQMNAIKLLGTRSLRWHVLTIVVLMGGLQLCGTNAAYFYTERTYGSTNVGISNVHYISIASTALLSCSTLLGIFLVDTLGRRVLLLIGFLACSILLILITMSLEIQQIIPEMSYVSAILIDLFLLGQSFGPIPVPPVIVVELFCQSSRASAFMIAGFVQWLISFITGVTFLHVQKQLGDFSFLLFFPVSIATFVYIFKILPETKKRTFVDIKRIMAIQTLRKIQVTGPVHK
ncbi:solute carrier family 2, facilitated glucose transporter member 5-like [Sceloporus undulatus]|uniref:solute carrier family 2, facilitated glucose transporter member 5-like n=1 Tax=Sceloporus undulatus TaxID=8520 RepID=UPI001C4C5915|nr:solute carrier family 2, facilitated glucose transporter member 5-like [Sceloporus undulatus]